MSFATVAVKTAGQTGPLILFVKLREKRGDDPRTLPGKRGALS